MGIIEAVNPETRRNAEFLEPAKIERLTIDPPVVYVDSGNGMVHKRAVIGFIDEGILEHSDRDTTVSNLKRLQKVGFPIGIISNKTSVDDIIATAPRGVVLNGFSIYGDSQIHTPHTSEDEHTEADSSEELPLIRLHQNVKDFAPWDGLDGILPFAVMNGGMTDELQAQFDQLSGAVFEPSEDITDQIGRWIVTHREVEGW